MCNQSIQHNYYSCLHMLLHIHFDMYQSKFPYILSIHYYKNLHILNNHLHNFHYMMNNHYILLYIRYMLLYIQHHNNLNMTLHNYYMQCYNFLHSFLYKYQYMNYNQYMNLHNHYSLYNHYMLPCMFQHKPHRMFLSNLLSNLLNMSSSNHYSLYILYKHHYMYHYMMYNLYKHYCMSLNNFLHMFLSSC